MYLADTRGWMRPNRKINSSEIRRACRGRSEDGGDRRCKRVYASPSSVSIELQRRFQAHVATAIRGQPCDP
jgi:hypothetical protein